MRRSWFVVVCFTVVTACAGDDGANKNPQCHKAIYDVCGDEHDCDSALCRPFDDITLPICTAMCTAGDDTTCPKQNGKVVTCGSDGLCHPPMANACLLGL